MSDYATQSLYEGAYLMAHGFELAGKESESNKVTLLFKSNPKINEMIIKFLCICFYMRIYARWRKTVYEF